MGKKRYNQSMAITSSPIKVEIKDETGGSDILIARDRLKGALRELLQNSATGSSSDSSEENSIQDYKHHSKKMSKSFNFSQKRKIMRRRQFQVDAAFRHTYVMKLFDRSVDLAKFQEDTPLYPICRAWIANQPRNPNLIPKVRSPSPEIVNEIGNYTDLLDASEEIPDVYYMPSPVPCDEAISRMYIPRPILSGKEELKLDHDEQPLKSREVLLTEHRIHWNAVRKKWHQRAHENELRYVQSHNILNAIFQRSQSEFEQ